MPKRNLFGTRKSLEHLAGLIATNFTGSPTEIWLTLRYDQQPRFIPPNEIHSTADLENYGWLKDKIPDDMTHVIKRLKYDYEIRAGPLIFLWWICPRQNGEAEVQLMLAHPTFAEDHPYVRGKYSNS